ncbi:hypothetical protein SEA_SAKAI_80 [Arthrobacter phage Sakai]|nr:hypothetical protein SEA_GORPY_81 [Arthrobacter phage Gorpy]UVK62027.1 hypothetical protein SEA_SAKAI_80 [Arthrobacter phage Sakai]
MTARKKCPVKREKCGTVAGWNAHQRHEEYPCTECTEAKTIYTREWRHRSGRTNRSLYTNDEIAAIRAEVPDAVKALIEHAERREGALYCHVTTYELRQALGMNVDDWPPLRMLNHTTDHEAVPTGAASLIPANEQDTK